MVESLKILTYALRSRFKSRMRLETENLVLRQQLNIAIRNAQVGGFHHRYERLAA